MKILITGATGNVGSAILRYIDRENNDVLIANRYKDSLKDGDLYFDIENSASWDSALNGVDVLFLLRPPHIADVKKCFKPLIAQCKISNVRHIVFLSVQGAESTPYIPHAKIEKCIAQSGINYTFMRPSYFMQNLTTTLKEGIVKNNEIYLPSASAPFLWVDVDDIGRATAAVLNNISEHRNKAYTITGSELLNFYEIANILSSALHREIKFTSPSLLKFYRKKRKEGVSTAYIFVLIMLHYLPRFQKKPTISNDYTDLTGLKPNSVNQFIVDKVKTLLK